MFFAFLAAEIGATPVPASSPKERSLQSRAPGGQVNDPSLQTTSINDSDGVGPGVDNYVFYQGDGTTGAGWPDKSTWVSFEDM